MREINAFALPGGPIYMNRGMVQAATVEGEVAGVIAHELSHVILRHGTAGATKQQPFQIGAVAGAIAGAIIGGKSGRWFRRAPSLVWDVLSSLQSRVQKQADLLRMTVDGARRIQPARPDAHVPDDRETGRRQQPADSSAIHPNPGNREAYIAQEASHLRIERQPGDPGEFARVQDRLRSMSPAPTTEQVTRQGTQTRTRSGQPAPDARRNPRGVSVIAV